MMTPTPPPDFVFSNSPAIIYSIISGLVGVIMFLLWRSIEALKTDYKDVADDLRKSISLLFDLHRTCKDELRKEFLTRNEYSYLEKDLDEVKRDRKEKWRDFFAHKHNTNTGRAEIE